jgi:hypothetical protein
MASGLRPNRRPSTSLGDRLQDAALPRRVKANPSLVRALRRELNRYERGKASKLRAALNGAIGDRNAARKVSRALIRLSDLMRQGGVRVEDALRRAFPGAEDTQWLAFQQWRVDLDRMAVHEPALSALTPKRHPGRRRELAIAHTCARVAAQFQKHGLKTGRGETGPFPDTLRLVLEAINGKLIHDVRPHVRAAIEEGKAISLD